MLSIVISESNGKLLYANGVKEYKISISKSGTGITYQTLKFNIVSDHIRPKMVLRGAVDESTGAPLGSSVTNTNLNTPSGFLNYSIPLEINVEGLPLDALNRGDVVTLIIELEAGQGVGETIPTPTGGFDNPYFNLIINNVIGTVSQAGHSISVIMNELPP